MYRLSLALLFAIASTSVAWAQRDLKNIPDPDPELERKLAGGSAYVTDARGIEVSPDATLSEGSILRVVVSARRAGEERDAHA